MLAEPLSGARYQVAIDGREVALFSKLVQARSAVVNIARVLGGHAAKQSCLITLGSSSANAALDAWHDAGASGAVGFRKDFTLTAFDNAGDVMLSWSATDGWPAKLTKTPTGDIAQATFKCATLHAIFP
jgi:hypothetical protein